MFMRIYNYFYKRISPIGYAKKIGVKVGKGCRLINVSFSTEPYLISLGDRVSATGVHFETHDGGVWVLREDYPNIDRIKPIIVGNNVFIGYKTLILPGVTIGDNVVIGAYSVVTNTIPSNCVAAGVPARPIKSLDSYKENILLDSDNSKNLTEIDKRKYYIDKYKVGK